MTNCKHLCYGLTTVTVSCIKRFSMVDWSYNTTKMRRLSDADFLMPLVFCSYRIVVILLYILAELMTSS